MHCTHVAWARTRTNACSGLREYTPSPFHRNRTCTHTHTHGNMHGAPAVNAKTSKYLHTLVVAGECVTLVRVLVVTWRCCALVRPSRVCVYVSVILHLVSRAVRTHTREPSRPHMRNPPFSVAAAVNVDERFCWHYSHLLPLSDNLLDDRESTILRTARTHTDREIRSEQQ